jgi:hypothetical protein
MIKEFSTNKFYVTGGWCWHRLAFGIAIGKYGFDLDLGFFWFNIEW